MMDEEWKADPRMIAIQEARCCDLLRTARDLKAQALVAEAQARAIAKNWSLDLDKLAVEP